MNATLIRTKLIAERGEFFYNIFNTLPYLDLDSDTLSNVLNAQMAEWKDYQKAHEAEWVDQVRSQLRDMSEKQLQAFYDRICNEKEASTRLILHKIFAEHRTLDVNTELLQGDEFPEITTTTDYVYQGNSGDYHYSDSSYGQREYWCDAFDCSDDDFQSLLEYGRDH